MAITTFNGPVASQNGFQLPSFTNSQILAIPNPATGLLVFNSTLNDIAYYTGTAWVGAVPPVAPSVSGISPPTGAEAGGTNVTISGTNFVDVSAVTIGGTPVTSYTVVSPTSITAVTAAHAAGASSVNVTNAGGTNAPNTLFTYAAPSVSYYAGTDYTNGGANGLTVSGSFVNPSAATMRINSGSWSNTAALASVLSQPAGAVFNVLVEGVTVYTLTTTGRWADSAGISVNVTGWTGGMGPALDISEITFSPAAAVTYSSGTDYTLGTLFWNDMSSRLDTAGTWTNTAAQALLQSQPIGSTYTMVGSVGTGAFLQQGAWGVTIGGQAASGARTQPFTGGLTFDLTSITFSAQVTTTYQAGDEFAGGGAVAVAANSLNNVLEAFPAQWTDTGALNTLVAQPLGTQYSVVYDDTTTGTISQIGAWAFLSGYWSVQATGLPFGPTKTIVSITFYVPA